MASQYKSKRQTFEKGEIVYIASGRDHWVEATVVEPVAQAKAWGHKQYCRHDGPCPTVDKVGYVGVARNNAGSTLPSYTQSVPNKSNRIKKQAAGLETIQAQKERRQLEVDRKAQAAALSQRTFEKRIRAHAEALAEKVGNTSGRHREEQVQMFADYIKMNFEMTFGGRTAADELIRLQSERAN